MQYIITYRYMYIVGLCILNQDDVFAFNIELGVVSFRRSDSRHLDRLHPDDCDDPWVLLPHDCQSVSPFHFYFRLLGDYVFHCSTGYWLWSLPESLASLIRFSALLTTKTSVL